MVRRQKAACSGDLTATGRQSNIIHLWGHTSSPRLLTALPQAHLLAPLTPQAEWEDPMGGVEEEADWIIWWGSEEGVK